MTPRPPGFWETVGLLLSVSRRRSLGRISRQQALLQHRTGSSTNVISMFGVVMFWLGMAFLNGIAGYLVNTAVEGAVRAAGKDNCKNPFF